MKAVVPVVRSGSLLAVALTLLPLLAGCPPPYPKCKDDSNCTSHGQVCVNGLCQECRDDSQCKPNFTCQDGACVKKPLPPGTCDTPSDCPGGEPCVNHKCGTPDAGVPEADAGMPEAVTPPQACDLETVHFDFNDYALTEQARSILQHDADCIRQSGKKVRIEGNCDERGTEEYNLVLGQNRADAVKRYLAGLGVNEADMKTVSYGKLRPKDPGHNEEAWATNRRADFVWR